MSINRETHMKIVRYASPLFGICLLCLSIFNPPAHAAPGDDSFDPNPDVSELNRDAQFDSFTLLSYVISTPNRYSQNFESGFTPGQQLSSWFSLGGMQMRVGFGANINSISWTSRIGGIDASSNTYGLTHPHGTYGNAPGVLSPARNYVNDLNFLTYDGASPPGYLVMQFNAPITFLSFGLTDYADGVGGNVDFSIWNGTDLQNLTQVANTTHRNVPEGTLAGDFQYFASPSQASPFNFAILHFDTLDATLGLDNIHVGGAQIPEPESHALLLAGLALVATFARKRAC